MAACKYGLMALFGGRSNIQINCKIVNTTVVVYINKKGGTKSIDCLKQAKDIWKFCELRQIWIVANYLQGILNIEAEAGCLV